MPHWLVTLAKLVAALVEVCMVYCYELAVEVLLMSAQMNLTCTAAVEGCSRTAAVIDLS